MKMSRKLICLVVAVIGVISLLAIEFGYAASDLKPAPTPAPVPTKPIELKFATHIPPVAKLIQGWTEWGKKVEQLSNGRLKITVYPAGSLVPYTAQYPSLMDGTVDITMLHSRLVPTWYFEEVMSVPMLDWTIENRMAIRFELEKAYPKITEGRNKEVKTLFRGMNSLSTMMTRGKEIKVPDDIKGMIFTGSVEKGDLIEACGGKAEFLGPPDWYTSLERGVIDGISVTYDAANASKVLDVVKYIYHMPYITRSYNVVMNKKAWDNLPADLKQIVETTAAEVEKADLDRMDWEAAYAKVKADGKIKMYSPTPQEIALWKDKAVPVREAILKDIAGKGFAAKEGFDAMLKVMAAHKK